MNTRTTIQLRTTPDEKAHWQQQADAEGVTLSDMIRARVNAAPIARVSPAPPAPSSDHQDGAVQGAERKPKRALPCGHGIAPWNACPTCDA